MKPLSRFSSGFYDDPMHVMDLLTSPWLRRLAYPLRAAHPRLYSDLNRVRRLVMTRGDSMGAHQSVALRRFAAHADLRGARVLEIGSDPDLKMLQALVRRGARTGVGINNDPAIARGQAPADGLQLVHADAARLPFDDASFDHVFSVSVFEHILDLPRALREMHRVLRPGGVLYSNFGPIWSSGKGHHVRVSVGDKQVRHFMPETNPIPDHAHLLLTPEEMRAGLERCTDPELIEPIVQWVYRDDALNRRFHHEYVRMFDEAPLRRVHLAAERDPLPAQLRRILELRYPHETNFDVTNIEVVLTKTNGP